MSRIGKQPILIPDKISVSLAGNEVIVKSGEKQLTQAIPEAVTVAIKDNQVLVSVNSEARPVKALHGLIRSLIANMITGLVSGFTKTLELQGTGYRVTAKGEGIELSLGFSHPINFTPPKGIKLEVKDNKFIIVTGADKYLVGQVAANIRHFRSPDAYKGKGVRYQGELIKLKPGKAAKSAGD